MSGMQGIPKETNAVHADSMWRQRIMNEQQCAREWEDNWGMFGAEFENKVRQQIEDEEKGGERPAAPAVKNRTGVPLPAAHTPQTPVAPAGVEDVEVTQWSKQDSKRTHTAGTEQPSWAESKEHKARKQERELVPKAKYAFPKTTTMELGWRPSLEKFDVGGYPKKKTVWD